MAATPLVHLWFGRAAKHLRRLNFAWLDPSARQNAAGTVKRLRSGPRRADPHMHDGDVVGIEALPVWQMVQ
jgi:hypothetical protein